MVGSGLFKFDATERVVGSRVVYTRHADYVPRTAGSPEWTSGPKIVNFDRIEWHIIPDAATAAAALQQGEMDWWDHPATDMILLLQRDHKIIVKVTDQTGLIGCLRPNALNPPLDNPRIRRALLQAISQNDDMIAGAGTDPAMRHVPAGIFAPGTPLASTVGLQVFTGPRDYPAAKREIEAAGYRGEKVVLLAPTDFAVLKALADVGADMMQKIGLNVEYQAMDWGTVVQRRTPTKTAGPGRLEPVPHVLVRSRPSQSGRPRFPAWQRQGGRARLAYRAKDRIAARGLDQRAGPGGAKQDRPGTATAGSDRSAVCAAGPAIPTHVLSR